MHLVAFPVAQWRINKALSAYSRGGGCGIGPPVRIGLSTFPFDPLMLGIVGEPCLLFCTAVCGCVKVECDLIGQIRGVDGLRAVKFQKVLWL